MVFRFENFALNQHDQLTHRIDHLDKAATRMNLNQIRFAVSVSESKSFSQAAKDCFVTQPTLSNGIAQLENILGKKLFHRNTREVSLTSFGEEVIPKLEKLLIDSESIVRFSKNWEINSPNEIRIGVSPVVNMLLLQELIAPFRESHPNVEFYYQECYLDDLEDLLKETLNN